MARTPLMSLIRRMKRTHDLAAHRGVPVLAVHEERALLREQGLPSRRRFLFGAAAAIGAIPFAPGCSSGDGGGGPGGGGAKGPRIAIVGAGLSGLACALALKDKGYAATVYDVSKHRVGGRMISERGAEPTGCNTCHAAPYVAKDMSFSEGQVADLYCELIDTDHTTVQDLAKRFGLELTDALGAEPEGASETYYFGGGYYLPKDADADFAAVYDAIQKDAADAGWPVTYDTANAAARALDSMSAAAWIDQRIPGGRASRLGSLIDVAYRMEYGAETRDQSALNILSMLSGSEQDPLSILGVSDEKFRIKGGVDQLPRAMADHLGLGSTVQLGYRLEAIREESDGTYALSFSADGTPTEVRADYVVLALPFGALRTLDYSKAGFDALKHRAIQEQGVGRNVKIQLQFDRRLWNEPGPWGVSGGTTYSDRGSQLTWDPTRGQPGTSGILVGYQGGDGADSTLLDHPYGNNGNPKVVADAKAFLAEIEPIFPGISAIWNGKVAETKPMRDWRFNGSYAYYKVGQTQVMCGYEHAPQKNVFFCGEHTSLDYLGFMEGAALEGQGAAEQVLSALGVPSVTPKSARVRRARRARRAHP